jgi:L-fucose isomerase-like protein
MKTSIYTLTSELHDEQSVNAVTQEFLGSLDISYDFKADDYSDYGTAPLSLIYVRTGGTEGIFRRLLPQLPNTHHPIYLLTSGKSNSLAASMEILSYLRQQQLQGEIIHGSAAYVSRRINLLQKAAEARRQLQGCRLGIIGEPSDWLISSHTDPAVVKERLGVELVNISMQELLDGISQTPITQHPSPNTQHPTPITQIQEALPGAQRIYEALKALIGKHRLQGFTLRCFDLLTAVRNTGCLALAKLNAEGYVAGCEGDVPAMLSMMIIRSLTGVSGFQANPATIDPESGQLLFAHCTIPFDLVESYELDTHYESGIGVGIRGYMATGPVTIFKASADLQRCFIAEGQLLRNQSKADLCRTQQVIQLDHKEQASYFLTNPIGNHHIIVPGHQAELLRQVLQ